MNKKTILLISILVLLVVVIILSLTQIRPSGVFSPTVPLLPTPSTSTFETSPNTTTGIPKQTDVASAIQKISDTKSLAEKDKLKNELPFRINDFPTSVNIKTTINISSFSYDPPSSLRLEIYGINYNDSEISGPQATAFKESFLAAKNIFLAKKVNLKDLQIIYGNRQYIQDTATYWVNIFKLLD
jgi:hypothetical protein